MKLKHDVFRVYTRWAEISKFTLLCLVLIFGFWLIGKDFRENYIIQPALLAEGVETTGTCIDRERRQTSVDGGIKITYFLTYSYTVDEHTYTRKYTTNERTYFQLRIGDAVSVHYLPDTPHVSRTVDGISQPTFDDHVNLTTSVELYLLPLLFFLQQIALRLFGRPIDGEITHISGGWENSLIRGQIGKYVITVRYQFVEPITGNRISGQVRANRNDLVIKPLPESGTRLVILYLNRYLYRVL